jgi:hypothetical protein
MPNYCDNELSLSCPSNPQKIKELWALIEEDDGKFLAFLRPEPNYDEIIVPFISPDKGEPQKGRRGAWYDWRCENWGTKWDIDDPDLSLEDGKIVGSFRTAWAPPTAAIMDYWKKNPEVVVDLKYIEIGCDFCGHLTLDEEFECNPSDVCDHVNPITGKRMWRGHEEDDQRQISDMTQKEWRELAEATEELEHPLAEYVYEMNWWDEESEDDHPYLGC